MLKVPKIYFRSNKTHATLQGCRLHDAMLLTNFNRFLRQQGKKYQILNYFLFTAKVTNYIQM